ncbi:TSUP family transporter [Ideonella sp. A 288]|uniref:sulfite exporter TauE/SafE family protein n=1 Tax=Ideonella sp. A 288 TaxID=1962181 RepID=UPI000B4B6A65|nr:TSUP family transporter [Ideonella sp. A 288]
MLELIAVLAASALAGFVDAVVGGGGLVLVPALFSAYPGAAPATLFGTNKAAAVWGTAWSCAQYFKRIQLSVRSLLPAVAMAGAGSWVGAGLVSRVDATDLRRALPLVLVGLLAYTLTRKDLGSQHAPRWRGGRQAMAAAAIGLVIGVYDGFFGPGTGSFLVFLFVRVLGYDFLHASAAAKLLNTATNSAALVRFSIAGQVWWEIGLMLAVANVAGSLIGTRLALRHGSGFVRGMFVVVVSALILKTGYDGYLR